MPAKERRSYEYTPTYEDTVKLTERKAFDSIYKGDVKLYKPKVGANLLRILPPGWKNAKHYGYPIHVHNDIGPNDKQYLCLRENEHSPFNRCPICDAIRELGPRATKQERDDLRPKGSYLFYVIDRDAEKEGVQVWRTSMRNNTEVAIQTIDRRRGNVLNITHPENGYDLEFTRIGTTRNGTRYQGFMIMRESSPLSDSDKRADQWLDYVFEHPLPDVLQFYEPEKIEEEFLGKTKDADEDEDKPRSRRANGRDEEEEPRQLRRTRTDDEDEDKPARSARRSRDEEEEEKPARRRASRDDDEDEEKPTRRRAARDDDEEEEKPTRRRTELEKDLDDEIPEKGARAKSNGKDEDEEERPARRTRARLDDDEEEKPTRRRAAARDADEEEEEKPARRRASRDADEPEEDERPARRARRTDDEDEEQEGNRRRMRERLDRS